VNLFEARKLAREVMYDDQLAAVEAVARAILKDPDDPGLPTVLPPEESGDPQTGVHVQGTTEPAEPVGGEVIELVSYTDDNGPGVPEVTDYEMGWRAGRGAAVRAIEDLVSQSVRQSPEEAAWVTALNVVNALEVKGEP
jgi:hypothetical protein